MSQYLHKKRVRDTWSGEREISLDILWKKFTPRAREIEMRWSKKKVEEVEKHKRGNSCEKINISDRKGQKGTINHHSWS